jgi:hypothetical protein
MTTDTLSIPLRSRTGEVLARAVVDAEDAHLADTRWAYCRQRGYAFHLGPGRKPEMLHRKVMGCVKGDGMQVDHINGDRLDNRRENLRLVTQEQGGQNIVRRPGLRGVTWDKAKRRWVAQAKLRGRNKFLGYFSTAEEAAQRASEFRREHMPFSEEERACP